MINKKYHENIRSEMLQFIPKEHGSRVLDLGCGDGNFQKLLRSEVKYTGVDLINQQNFMHNSKNTYIQGDVIKVMSSLIAENNKYDLIVCNDIIEHLPDTSEFFMLTSQLLRRNGLVVGSVPNVRYVGNLFELIFKRDWRYKKGGGVLDSTHLRFFTEKSLLRIMSKSEFKVIFLKGINGFSDHKSIKRALVYTALRIMDIIFLRKS